MLLFEVMLSRALLCADHTMASAKVGVGIGRRVLVSVRAMGTQSWVNLFGKASRSTLGMVGRKGFLSTTLPANPLALLINVSVRLVVRMALRTVSLAGILRSNIVTSHYVLTHCHRLKMGWINAERRSAQMVDGQPAWDWANDIFVGKAMYLFSDLLAWGNVVRKSGIATLVRISAGPEPAVSALINLFPKQIRRMSHVDTSYVEYNTSFCVEGIQL